MNIFQAIVLGVIQGLAEFFPISSSAHLRLAKWAMSIPDGEQLLYFDLMCHAGTLAALFYFLRRDVFEILRDVKKIGLFSIALLPLVPAYFLLKPVRLALSDPSYMGYSLLATSLFLFAATQKKSIPSQQKTSHVVCIGMAQALALIPGISRSGATMAMARVLGWEWKQAARFSILLAIPAILGGELLETIKLMKGNSESIGAVSPLCYAAGFFAALSVGFIAVRFAFSLYDRGVIRPFAWYCLGAGLIAWACFGTAFNA